MCLSDALGGAGCFNVHSHEELMRTDPSPAPKRNVAKLVAQVEAAKIVREKVLPMSQQPEKDLGEYAKDYVFRRTSIEERKKSWIPSVLQDAILGSLCPLQTGPVEVEKLQQNLSERSYLLRKLPAFLDRFELHFRRLSEITSQQIFDLGYTSSGDLNRLYQDRLICGRITENMAMLWIEGGAHFWWELTSP